MMFNGMPDDQLIQRLNQQAKLAHSISVSVAPLAQQALEVQRHHLVQVAALANSTLLPAITRIQRDIEATIAPTIERIQRDAQVAAQIFASLPTHVFEELRQAQEVWLHVVRYSDEFARLQRILGTNLSQFLREQAFYYQTWLEVRHDAFTEAFVLCADYLLYQALRILENTDDAKDVVQDVYEKALRQLQTFSVERILHLKVRPWLSKIVKTTALNVLRDRRRDDPYQTGWTIQEQQPGNRFDQPEAAVVRQELIEALREAYRTLPSIQREIISMRFSGTELSWNEIANALDCPPTRVRVYYSRGIKKLRQLLTDQKFSGADF